MSLFPKSDILQFHENLLKSHISIYGFLNQQIESFNYFIDHKIKKIVSLNSSLTFPEFPMLKMNFHKIWVENVQLNQGITDSKITPIECSIRNLTYSAPIYAEIEYINNGKHFFKNKVYLGEIPIMVKSNRCILYQRSEKEHYEMKQCPTDPGGYFIVNGIEKAMLIQENNISNTFIFIKDSKKFPTCYISSIDEKTKTRATLVLKKQNIYLRHNSLSEDIPLAILLRSLGIRNDKEISDLLSLENHEINEIILSQYNFEKNHLFLKFGSLSITTEKCIEFLGSKVKSYIGEKFGDSKTKANIFLDRILLSHIEETVSELFNERKDILRRKKAIHCCYMARQLIIIKRNKNNIKWEDDLDHLMNKTFNLSGDLIGILFEDLYKKLLSEIVRHTKYKNSKVKVSNAFDPTEGIRPNIITNGMKLAISTGNWNLGRFKMSMSNITQSLPRMSYLSALEMLSRIASHLGKSTKISSPRSLKPSHWGMICPVDTPEGESIGLIKHLALLSMLTLQSSKEDLRTFILEILKDQSGNNSQKVINNNINDEIREEENFLFSKKKDDYNNNIKDNSFDFTEIEKIEIIKEDYFFISLQGELIGQIKNPELLFQMLVSKRREGKISRFVNFRIDRRKKLFNIFCDNGRICRALIIVKNKNSLVTEKDIFLLKSKTKNFEDFVKEGKIEFLDVNEEQNSLIALYKNEIKEETTHLEIDPISILGILGGLIPFSNHNQSPRNTYQCSMGKQSICISSFNYQHRADSIAYNLVYGQRPIVETKTQDLVGLKNLPTGTNVVLAVLSYSGYDIEDAIILNKASLDRGFGRCIVYRKFECVLNQIKIGASEKIMPKEDENDNKMKRERKKGLDSDGLPDIGKVIEPGSVMFNKYVPETVENVNSDNNIVNINKNDLNPLSSSNGVKEQTELVESINNNDNKPKRKNLNIFSNQTVYKSEPVLYKGKNAMRVDGLYITSNMKNSSLFKLRTRETRRPELGDKFSSRHGQKGVCGLIVNQEDLPFTEDGIVPDIIMNPHGFPSRMTVGKILELITGKAAVMEGKVSDGSTFSDVNLEQIEVLLEKYGFEASGKEKMISGITGEVLEAKIFIGPVYYQKLKHMVGDKFHFRTTGPNTMLTRQPTEGRSREGGLRVGEMERDCLISHGAAYLINERLMKSSDDYTVSVCKRCGFLGYDWFCSYCKKSDSVVKVKMGYACKLMLQELYGMGIYPKIQI